MGLGPLSPAGQLGPGLHALPAPGLRRLGLEEVRQLFLHQLACARLTPRVPLPRSPRSRWACRWWNQDCAPFNARARVQGGGPGAVSPAGHCAVDVPVTGAGSCLTGAARGAPRLHFPRGSLTGRRAAVQAKQDASAAEGAAPSDSASVWGWQPRPSCGGWKGSPSLGRMLCRVARGPPARLLSPHCVLSSP